MHNAVQILTAQHDELRELAKSYEREVSRPEPDLQALARCRWTLTRLISAHLACERVHMKALDSRPEPVVGQMAPKIKRLTDHLEVHVRKWTADSIVREWAEYCRLSRTIISDMCSLMDEEERRLYPLINQAKAA